MTLETKHLRNILHLKKKPHLKDKWKHSSHVLASHCVCEYLSKDWKGALRSLHVKNNKAPQKMDSDNIWTCLTPKEDVFSL